MVADVVSVAYTQFFGVIILGDAITGRCGEAVSYTHLEEGTEEVIVHVQIPVSVYHVTQVNTAFPDFLVAHVAPVHAVATLVQLGWILGSGHTARGEAVAVARPVGMPVDLSLIHI